MIKVYVFYSTALIVLAASLTACQDNTNNKTAQNQTAIDNSTPSSTPEINPFLNKPLISHLFTADPAAHVFNGKIYIYPSHDIESNVQSEDGADLFDMVDYHVFSLDDIHGNVVDHGVALAIGDIPWASRQLWAPDATEKNGKYFLYFPAKDKQDIFRIGVATSETPEGPFIAESTPIAGSLSIDPSVFKDDDSQYYLYVGGIWGGQLQRWTSGHYLAEDIYPADDEPALAPKVARLSEDMLSFAEKLHDIQLLDKDGSPLLAGDNSRRFFEAAWVHKHQGTYYFSYSTGDTHLIAYATGSSPYGPFTYQGTILEPVLGWTNHHSIVAFKDTWYLFYHDTELSKGKTHLRNLKVTELTHDADGRIKTIDAYLD